MAGAAPTACFHPDWACISGPRFPRNRGVPLSLMCRQRSRRNVINARACAPARVRRGPRQVLRRVHRTRMPRAASIGEGFDTFRRHPANASGNRFAVQQRAPCLRRRDTARRADRRALAETHRPGCSAGGTRPPRHPDSGDGESQSGRVRGGGKHDTVSPREDEAVALAGGQSTMSCGHAGLGMTSSPSPGARWEQLGLQARRAASSRCRPVCAFQSGVGHEDMWKPTRSPGRVRSQAIERVEPSARRGGRVWSAG